MAREGLLKDLHDHGRITDRGLAHEQVKMLGHDHIAYEGKLVPCSDSTESLNKEITIAWARQGRHAVVAAASDEVQVVQIVVAMEPIGHGQILTPTPNGMKNSHPRFARMGHPIPSKTHRGAPPFSRLWREGWGSL